MDSGTANAPSLSNNGAESNQSYRCNICLEKFTEIQSIDTHMLSHDLQKPYRCNYCACSYGNIKALQVHVATHNIDMPYACERCDEIFCVLRELQSHVETNCLTKDDKQRQNDANNKSSHPGLRTRSNLMNKRVSYCDDEDDFVDNYLDDDFVNETMVTVPENRNNLPATKKTTIILPHSQNSLPLSKKAMVKSTNVLHTTAGDETNSFGYVSLSNLSVAMASNKSLITKPVSDLVNESSGIEIQERERPVVLSNNHRLFSAYIPLMDVRKLEQTAKQKNNKLKNVSKNLQALKSLKKAKLSGVRKRAPQMKVSTTAWAICTYCCEVHKNIRRHHNKHGRSQLERCGFCHLKLANRYSVLRHCRSTHMKQNCLRCKFCDAFIGSEQQYVKHYLERHTDTQVSNTQDTISVELPIEKLQIKLEHADEALVGGVCVKCCEFHINLSDHLCKHPTDHHMCGFCYLVLETDLSLAEHYISEHQNKEEFACMICGLFLGSENTYKKHFVEVHSVNSNHRNNMNATASKTDIIAVANINVINTTAVANRNNMNMTTVANRNDLNMTSVANRNNLNLTTVANSNDINITNRKVSCISDEASSVEHTRFNENDTIFPYEDDLDNGADDLDFSESDEDDWFTNETENGDKKVTKLSICSFCCEVHPNLKRHQFTHSPEILKTCGFCSMKLATKNSVIRHCKLMHKRKKLLQCMLCVNTFPGSETNYIKHFMEFHPSKSTKGVNKDLVEFGSDAEESQYETSSDSSSDVSEDFDSRLDISDTKLYVCESCCQVTSDLKSHQRDHSNSDLKKCGFCCVVLSSKGSISRHFHQVHRKRKEVDCKICHQMIGSEKRYIRHYLTVHGSPSAMNEMKLSVAEPSENETLQEDEGGSICLVCCEVVQVKLAYHEYTHHEDSMNTCGFCNAVLATKASLKRHYNRVHRRKGEFVCMVCKKFVGSERNYKKHYLQTHSDKSNVDKSNNSQNPTADAGNAQSPVGAGSGCTESLTNNETEPVSKDKPDTTVMSSVTSNDRSETVMMSSITTNDVSETAVMPSLATKDKSEGSIVSLPEKEMMSSMVTESTSLSSCFSGNNGGLTSDRMSNRKLKHMSICEFCCEVHSKIKRHRFCHAQSTLTRCGFCGLKLATKNSVIRHYQKVHLEKHRLFCLICNQMIGMEHDYKIHFFKFHTDKTFPSDINCAMFPQEPHNEKERTFDNAATLTSNIPSNSTLTNKLDVDNIDSRILIDQIPKLPDISDDSDCSMPEMSSSDDDDADDDEPGESHLSIVAGDTSVAPDDTSVTADGSKSSSSFPKAEILEAPPITSTMDEKPPETSIKKVKDKMKICRHCCEVHHNLKGHRYQHTQSDLYYCGFCGKTFNSRETSSKHYRVSHKSCNNLVCRFCTEFIGSETEYIEHILTKHEDKGPAKAPESFPEHVLQLRKERRTRFSVCEYCCEVHKNLRKHYKSHLPAMFGKCGFCGEVVNVKTSAKDHYQQAHRDAKNINCKVCKSTFNSETAYKRHYRSLHSCGFNGDAKEEEAILPIRGQYQCTVCDKAFTRERVFRRHRLSHLEKHLTCEVCNEVFYGERMLKIHRKLNHLTDQEVTCQFCLKAFTSEIDLKTHEKTVHVEDKTYTCHFCAKTYCSRISLKQHVKKYHDSNAKFRFTCKDCGKGFDYKAMFRAHQQIHSGEKPWVCEYCGQGFRTKHIFKTHLNRHTDSRPHKCPYCEKSFRQVTTLKTHQRTHTGVKPYVCHECGKSFGDLSNYHSHRRSNHNNPDLKVQTPNVPSRRTRVRKQSTPMSSYFSPYPHIPTVPRTTSRDASSTTKYDESTTNYQDFELFHDNKQEH